MESLHQGKQYPTFSPASVMPTCSSPVPRLYATPIYFMLLWTSVPVLGSYPNKNNAPL